MERFTKINTERLRRTLIYEEEVYLQYIHSDNPSWVVLRTLAEGIRPIYKLLLARIAKKGLDRKSYLQDLKVYK